MRRGRDILARVGSTSAALTPTQIKRFVGFQIAATCLIYLILFGVSGGATAGSSPPVWQWAVLLGFVAAASALVSEWWTRPPAIDAAEPDPQTVALSRLTAHIGRSFLVLALPFVIAAFWPLFGGGHDGWYLLIVGLPGIVAIVLGTWPTRRNIERFAKGLESAGATTGLREAFGR